MSHYAFGLWPNSSYTSLHFSFFSKRMCGQSLMQPLCVMLSACTVHFLTNNTYRLPRYMSNNSENAACYRPKTNNLQRQDLSTAST